MPPRRSTRAAHTSDAAPPPLPPPAQQVPQEDDLSVLRRQWKWAAFSQFYCTFFHLFSLNDVTVADIESDLVHATSATIPRIMQKLLYTLSYDRKISVDNWQHALRKQYLKRDPAANPLGSEPEKTRHSTKDVEEPQPQPDTHDAHPDDPERARDDTTERANPPADEMDTAADTPAPETEAEPKPDPSTRQSSAVPPKHTTIDEDDEVKEGTAPPHDDAKLVDWFDLPMLTKLETLHTLTEWQFVNPTRLRMVMKSDDELASWRVEPIGYDSKRNAYWCIGDRLWIQREPPKPPRTKALKRKRGPEKSAASTTTNSKQPAGTPAKRARVAPAPAPARTPARTTARASARTAAAAAAPAVAPSPATNGRHSRAAKDQAKLKLDEQARELAELNRLANLSHSGRPTRQSSRTTTNAAAPPPPPRPAGTRISARLRGSQRQASHHEENPDEDEWQPIPEEWLTEDVNGASSSSVGVKKPLKLTKPVKPPRRKTGLESDEESELTELSEDGGEGEGEDEDGGEGEDGEGGEGENGEEGEAEDGGEAEGEMDVDGVGAAKDEVEGKEAEAPASSPAKATRSSNRKKPAAAAANGVGVSVGAKAQAQAKSNANAKAKGKGKAKAKSEPMEEDEKEEGIKEEEEPYEYDVPTVVPPADFVEWETICVTLYEWEHVAERFANGTHYTEKALYKTLTNDIVPFIVHELREIERKRELEEALQHRKRSSRLALRESEKEQALAAQRKQQEEEEKMSRTRRLEARQQKEEAERVKREAAREQRRQEREAREEARRNLTIQQEAERLAKIEKAEKAEKEKAEKAERAEKEKAAKKAAGGGGGGGGGAGKAKSRTPSGQHHANGKRKHTTGSTNNKNSTAEEWELDCEICHRKGKNIDDGMPMVSCGRCAKWQHIPCHELADRQVGRQGRNWDSVDFICKACRLESYRTPQAVPPLSQYAASYYNNHYSSHTNSHTNGNGSSSGGGGGMTNGHGGHLAQMQSSYRSSYASADGRSGGHQYANIQPREPAPQSFYMRPPQHGSIPPAQGSYASASASAANAGLPSSQAALSFSHYQPSSHGYLPGSVGPQKDHRDYYPSSAYVGGNSNSTSAHQPYSYASAGGGGSAHHQPYGGGSGGGHQSYRSLAPQPSSAYSKSPDALPAWNVTTPATASGYTTNGGGVPLHTAASAYRSTAALDNRAADVGVGTGVGVGVGVGVGAGAREPHPHPQQQQPGAPSSYARYSSSSTPSSTLPLPLAPAPAPETRYAAAPSNSGLAAVAAAAAASAAAPYSKHYPSTAPTSTPPYSQQQLPLPAPLPPAPQQAPAQPPLER